MNYKINQTSNDDHKDSSPQDYTKRSLHKLKMKLITTSINVEFALKKIYLYNNNFNIEFIKFYY